MNDADKGLDEVILRIEAMVGKRKAKLSRLVYPLVIDVNKGTIRAVKPDDKIVPMPKRRET